MRMEDMAFGGSARSRDVFVIIELKLNEIDFDDFFDSNMNFGSLINVRMSKYMRARSYFLNFEYF